MPALSKKQQKFMGIVRSIQKGEQPASKFSKDAQDVAKDMKKSSVKKFAGTKHKGLPMKKEILGKLKEMIKQELSEYTYGLGDVVKDVNPTCPHYGAMGKVKSVNPRSVVFVVMNKGKNFKPGQTLEKSHDQMKKMNESINEINDKFVKYMNDFYGPKGLYVRTKKPLTLQDINKAYSILLKKRPRYQWADGDAFDRENLRDELIKLRILSKDLMNKKESVNEFSMKLQKSTRDMVDALLKIKNPMPKEIQSALMMMAKGYGLDYVKREVKKNPKDFYKNLKQMAAAFPEFRNKPKDYKFESINESLSTVTSGKDFSDKFLAGLELVIKQAQNLKGPLAKHPIKRDVSKLKAVQNLYKRFIQSEVNQKTRAFDAPDLTSIKKELSNGKFKSVIEYTLKKAITDGGFRGNYFSLESKTEKLRDRIEKVLRDIHNKLDKAQLENINEDGHTDVASAKRKVMIMVQDSNILLNKLNGMNKEDSLPSWWTDKITLSQNYLQKATDYITNPVESIKEFRNKREADTARDQIGHKALYMIGAKNFVFGKSDGKNSLVFKIMRNSKGVSHIRMRLTSLDLYDIDFLAIRAGKVKVKSKEKGVYGDQLRAMIKKNTGLNVTL